MKDNVRKFIQFAEKGVRFTTEVNKIIREEVVDGKPLKKTSTSSKCLNDIDDYSFFTIGPVYTIAKVPDDFLSKFAELTGFNEKVITYIFDKRVISNMNHAWGYTVQGIPTYEYDSFKKYMLSETMVRTADKEFWTVDRVPTITKDLLADYNGRDEDFLLDIYVPSGNKAKYIVDTTTEPPTIKQQKPSPGVISQAESVFNTTLLGKR